MATCKDCAHYDVCDALDRMNGIPKPGPIHCGFFKDKALTIDLPCKIGTHLYRVTHPYRGEPKVTEFVVKNFRTVGKKHQLQIEVQALNVPVTNWMRYQDFHTTREEAEDHLRKMYATAEKLKDEVEEVCRKAVVPEITNTQIKFKVKEDHA